MRHFPPSARGGESFPAESNQASAGEGQNNEEETINSHWPQATDHEPRNWRREMMNDIIQHTIRRRAEIARLRVENARLRAALAWAWFAIAAITLMGCYVLLVAYEMEGCR